MSSASNRLNEKVKVWVDGFGIISGEITHVYSNGDFQVCGLDDHEGVVTRVAPDLIATP